MNSLTIAGTTVTTDSEGRYSLNELHRASGGDTNNRPNQWLRSDKAKALIQQVELTAQFCVVTLEGASGGPTIGTSGAQL